MPTLLYRTTKVNHAQLDQPYALATFRWIAQVNTALCFGSQKPNFMSNFKKANLQSNIIKRKSNTVCRFDENILLDVF